MPKKCNVNESWFIRNDSDNLPISRWLKQDPQSTSTVCCTICLSVIQCNMKGFQAVQQHMNTQKHVKNLELKLAPSQLRLSGTHFSSSTSNASSTSSLPTALCSSSLFTSSESTSSSVSSVQVEPSNVSTMSLLDTRNDSIKAEIIWTLKVVESGYSGRSCDNVGDIFRAMFPNNFISNKFSLGKFKLAYMLTDCLGPHFRDLFLNDAKGTFFSLCFDETTNEASKKELQVGVRYYSEKTKRIQQHHLQTFFIDNSTGDTISEFLQLSVKNANPFLRLNQMLTLGRDGPNTNKKVFRLINEIFKKETGKSLLEIGSCNTHTVHNGFKKGLEAFGDDVSDFVIQIFHFFDGEPLRLDEFKKVQMKLKVVQHKFIKHVTSRWLTLHESASRVIEQWDVIEEYFLKWLPKNRPKGTDSVRYKTIVKYLKSGTMKAETYFVIESAAIYQPFLRYFQSDEPLIHKLQKHLTELLLKILNRIVDPKKVIGIEGDKITSASFETKNLKPIDNITLSENIISSLRDCKEADKAKFKLNVRQHLVATGLHIVTKTSYNNKIVKSLQYISPGHILKPESGEEIMNIAKLLPFPIPSTAIDEWCLIQAFVKAEKLDNFKGRVDDFWTKIFDLKDLDELPKFPAVSKIIKCFLCLTHGSADIERGFSISGNVLTDDKTSMTERTLNARLNSKCGLKTFYQNSSVSVPIDKDFINSARYAYHNYSLYIEKCKAEEQQKQKEKEMDEQRRMENVKIYEKILSSKNDIEKLERDLNEKIKNQSHNATKLLSEANERLKKAITNKNMAEISMAQGVLEGSKALLESEIKDNQEIDKLKAKVSKQKTDLLKNYLKRKPENRK